MSVNTDNESALHEIRTLARAWQDCDCSGDCDKCIARVIEIEDLAETRIRAFDGPLK